MLLAVLNGQRPAKPVWRTLRFLAQLLGLKPSPSLCALASRQKAVPGLDNPWKAACGPVHPGCGRRCGSQVLCPESLLERWSFAVGARVCCLSHEWTGNPPFSGSLVRLGPLRMTDRGLCSCS